MDEGAAATKVEWRAWGPAAFDAARTEDAPILLALVTPWSADCVEMDETTYAEPRIAANVNDGFVPIRVDADRRPRIRERYTMGGFPSTVFLTPRGQIIAGATYLGVDGFRGILASVRQAWEDRGEAAGSVPRALQDAGPPGGELSPRIEEAMVEQLLAAFDDEFGGWGSDVKFPMPRTVEFALLRARDQALRTLEAVRTHLVDTYDGGFYRLARRRDWGEPSREKLLDDNAALVRAFARAYRYTGDTAYRETATGAVEYLTTTLWSGDAFASSQREDETYYRLEPTERATADPPRVDPTVYADRNGVAIDACLWVSAYTDETAPREYARRARDFVVDELVADSGRVRHAAAGPTGLLTDHARLLGGLTTSWQVTGEASSAEAVARWAMDELQAESGAFADGPASGGGLLDRQAYPVDTNAAMAEGLLDLGLLTGNRDYLRASRRAGAAFAAAADRMGVELAHFATVAARLREPTAIRVGAPAGTDLHRAALRLADHETVVVPGAGDVAGTEAELVVDGTPVGAASDPAGLEAILTGDRD